MCLADLLTTENKKSETVLIASDFSLYLKKYINYTHEAPVKSNDFSGNPDMK